MKRTQRNAAAILRYFWRLQQYRYRHRTFRDPRDEVMRLEDERRQCKVARARQQTIKEKLQ